VVSDGSRANLKKVSSLLRLWKTRPAPLAG
jgi:hypothetical protein